MRSDLRPDENKQASDAKECEHNPLRKSPGGCVESRDAATDVVENDAAEHEDGKQQCKSANPATDPQGHSVTLRDERGNPQRSSGGGGDKEPEHGSFRVVALWLHSVRKATSQEQYERTAKNSGREQDEAAWS